jgi:probable phosphoglycerate mutase
LHERRVGALSGTPTHGSDGVWPDTLRLWIAGQTDYAPPGAESYDAIRARVLPAWERVMEYRPGETRVVVAHGVVIRVLLLNLLEGYGVADWQRLGPIRNVGVTELLHEETGWKAVRLNEPPSGVAEA